MYGMPESITFSTSEKLMRSLLEKLLKDGPVTDSFPLDTIEQCLFDRSYVLCHIVGTDQAQPKADLVQVCASALSGLRPRFSVFPIEWYGKKLAICALPADCAASEQCLCDTVTAFRDAAEGIFSAPAVCAVGLRMLVSSPFRGLLELRETYTELENSIDTITRIVPEKLVITEYDIRNNPQLMGEPFPHSEIERQLAECVLNLEFFKAESVFSDIIRHELSTPRSQLSFLPRISKRLDWILLVLHVPRNRGDQKSAWIYGYPLKIYYADSISEGIDYVHRFFQDLDEYYSAFRFNVGKNISQITDFIRDNYPDPSLDSTKICDRFRISQSYLSHMFKARTGMKLIDFIHAVRLEKAKALLKDTRLTVAEIARQTGYLGNGAMTRSFKRYERATPSEYRERARQAAEEAGYSPVPATNGG